jgi:peptidyl-prolyl cis-trans isomerase A (cyclophilin A)
MSPTLKLIPVCLLIAGCNSASRDSLPPIAGAQEVVHDIPVVNWIEGETRTDDAATSGEYQVRFETTAGDFTMLVHRDWAPRGAERMFQLITSHYYDGAPFYRVMPGFMVQFGMNGDPKGTQYWDRSFPDDPVTQSNQPGLVSFATSGPNTRSTQLFVNYGNNTRLDGMGFSPFAEIIEGMDKVNSINAQYLEQPDQGRMTAAGNEYVFTEFPKIDYIIRATFVSTDAPAS